MCFLLVIMIITIHLWGQGEVFRLWRDVPGMKAKPSKLYVYPAPDSINTGMAVIVCPGGSYEHTMGIATEGFEVAEWLNSQGINAFVLKYRVASQGYHHPAMMEDFQYAIHYVREHSSEYHIDNQRVGVMGFSAGGHLALMAGAFGKENFLLPFGVDDNISLRPDFVVSVYPVVSMQDSIAHQRSRRNLLTHHYTKEQQDHFSMELSLPDDMPPIFLVWADDDPVVLHQNSDCLANTIEKKGIRHCFCHYSTGGHGFGINEKLSPVAGKWKYSFAEEIKDISE